ncbi:signal peptidase I [bacterium]|nr:signal peptidase I [bacterium]
MLHEHAKDIHELWGMGGFAMSKIIHADSLYFSRGSVDLLIKHPGTKYFLELTHHASIDQGKNILDNRLIKRPQAGTSVSYIPLDNDSMQTIWSHLYTARFISNKGYLESFGHGCYNKNDRPKIKGHPEDGTYEFLDGTPYKIKWQNSPTSLIPSLAVPEKLSPDHPFANFSEEKCQTFYNTGIEQSLYVSNSSRHGIRPCRYAYYQDGDLYLMGAKIFDKESSTLTSFVEKEKEQEEKDPSYTPFIDMGAPILADGSIDKEKIEKYGLLIPKKQYYMLGDNHAQSGDSREFGFVPEDNIQGTTSFLFWAPGGRFGAPLQLVYHWYTPYKAFAWGMLFIGIGIYYGLERRKLNIIKKRASLHHRSHPLHQQ